MTAPDARAALDFINKWEQSPDTDACPVPREMWPVIRQALTQMIKGVPDGWVTIYVKRGEEYEDVHPELLVEDFLETANNGEWKYQIPPPTGEQS